MHLNLIFASHYLCMRSSLVALAITYEGYRFCLTIPQFSGLASSKFQGKEFIGDREYFLVFLALSSLSLSNEQTKIWMQN